MQARRCRAKQVIALLACVQTLGVLKLQAQAISGADLRRADDTKISLHYDPKLEAIGFHSPVVEGSVAGQDALFLIDTGASVHTFARWFAEAAGMKVQETDSTVSGSTNKEVRVEAVHDVNLQLHDAQKTLHLQEAIVVDFPPMFSQHRIGGLLSPQLLATNAASALLDMHAPLLRFMEARNSHGGRACINEHSQFRNRLYTVAIELGDKKAEMLVDSGATSTLLSSKSSIAGKLGGAKEFGRMQGVGGEPSKTYKLDKALIYVGGMKLSSSLSVAEFTPGCDADGILGMDLLKHCTIQLDLEGVVLSSAEATAAGPGR